MGSIDSEKLFLNKIFLILISFFHTGDYVLCTFKFSICINFHVEPKRLTSKFLENFMEFFFSVSHLFMINTRLSVAKKNNSRYASKLLETFEKSD